MKGSSKMPWGATTAIGLDFRTGLGQLMSRMSSPFSDYA